MGALQPGESYFEWVIHLTRGQLLDLVLEIESRLRQLVRAVLSEAKPDWETLVPGSIGVTPDYVGQVHPRLRDEEDGPMLAVLQGAHGASIVVRDGRRGGPTGSCSRSGSSGS